MFEPIRFSLVPKFSNLQDLGCMQQAMAVSYFVKPAVVALYVFDIMVIVYLNAS